MLKLIENKKGQTGGLITGLVFGIAGLVIGVVIAFVIIQTLTGADLLTDGSAEKNATDNLVANFSKGIDNVATKLPTVLLVGAVVLLLSILGMLVVVWQRMRLTGGGGGI